MLLVGLNASVAGADDLDRWSEKRRLGGAAAASGGGAADAAALTALICWIRPIV